MANGALPGTLNLVINRKQTETESNLGKIPQENTAIFPWNRRFEKDDFGAAAARGSSTADGLPVNAEQALTHFKL